MMQKLRSWMLGILLCASSCAAYAKGHAHYRIVLTEGYVGWVQIIFNDPASSPLPHDHHSGAYLIYVKNDGIVRTSDLLANDSSSVTEVVYMRASDAQVDRSVPVPNAYLIPGQKLGGFDIMDTGGKGRGYSWFFFIGPPELRAKFPNADWGNVAKQWNIDHGNKKVMFDGNYPIPGNIHEDLK